MKEQTIKVGDLVRLKKATNMRPSPGYDKMTVENFGLGLVLETGINDQPEQNCHNFVKVCWFEVKSGYGRRPGRDVAWCNYTDFTPEENLIKIS